MQSCKAAQKTLLSIELGLMIRSGGFQSLTKPFEDSIRKNDVLWTVNARKAKQALVQVKLLRVIVLPPQEFLRTNFGFMRDQFEFGRRQRWKASRRKWRDWNWRLLLNPRVIEPGLFHVAQNNWISCSGTEVLGRGREDGRHQKHNEAARSYRPKW